MKWFGCLLALLLLGALAAFWRPGGDGILEPEGAPSDAGNAGLPRPPAIPTPAAPLAARPFAEAPESVAAEASPGCVVRGRVVDAGGAGIAGARVWWRDTKSEARTDASGAFLMPEPIQPGRPRSLIASSDGYALESCRVSPEDGADAIRLLITLRAGGPIGGHIVDDVGRSLGAASLELQNLKGESESRARSDAEGRFRFPTRLWEPGVIRVVEIADIQTFRQPLPTLVARGGDLDLVFVIPRLGSSPARLEARIVDAGTFVPLWPVKASLVRIPRVGGHFPPDVSLEDGRVSSAAVPAGTWSLEVVTSDDRMASMSFDVRDGQSLVTLEIPVGRRGRLLGRVCSPRLAEIRDLVARTEYPAKGADEHWESLGITGSIAPIAWDGTFRYVHVVPGSFWITVTGVAQEGEFIGEAWVEMSSGGDQTVEIDLVRAGVLAFSGVQPELSAGLDLTVRCPGRAGDRHAVIRADPGTPFESEFTLLPESWEWSVVQRLHGGEAVRRQDEVAVLPGGTVRIGL